MPVPIINPPTSVLAPYVGESWAYQPSATEAPTSWKEVMPEYAFTVNSTTDVITASGSTFEEGDRVRVRSTTTLPAPLVEGVYYYVRDKVDATFKLALTPGGPAINFTTSGTGTHYAGESALPPGLSFNRTTGLISGVATVGGFYEITLIASNGSGDSTAFVFPIGVRDMRTLLDTAIALEWEWDKNLVSILGYNPSTNPKNPLLFIKNGDQIVFALRFVKGGLPFRPAITSLQVGLKDEDNQPVNVRSLGDFRAVGSGPDTRFYFLLDTTAVPEGGQSIVNVLDEAEVEGPDVVPGWLELRAGYEYDLYGAGSPAVYRRASRSIPVEIDRSIIL